MATPTIMGSPSSSRTTSQAGLTIPHLVSAGTDALLIYVAQKSNDQLLSEVTYGGTNVPLLNAHQPINLLPWTYLLLAPTPGTADIVVIPDQTELFFNSISVIAVNIGNYGGIGFADWAYNNQGGTPSFTPVSSMHTEPGWLVLSAITQVNSGATFTPVNLTTIISQGGIGDSAIKMALGGMVASTSYTTIDWTLLDYHVFDVHLMAIKGLDGVPSGAPYAIGPVTNSLCVEDQPAPSAASPGPLGTIPLPGDWWHWYHTVPGTHRTLVVLLTWNDPAAPVTSVTFGGVAMTDYYSPGSGRAMFVLEDAPIGTFLIEVKQGTSRRTFCAGAYSLASSGIVATNSQSSIFKTIAVDSNPGALAIALVDYGPEIEPYAYANVAVASGSTLLFTQPLYFNSNIPEGNRPNINGTADWGISVYTVATGTTASPSWTSDVSVFTTQITFSFTPLAAPVVTTEMVIPRRQRRAPHLSREQLWNFYSQFQLDLEAGVGLTTGQGSDPQIMLRWSDDGGHTWSSEHWVSAGARGEYARRAIWRRLGRSRDRVFEVTVSDPVAWNLLAAYLQVEPGTS